jgi:cytochrome c
MKKIAILTTFAFTFFAVSTSFAQKKVVKKSTTKKTTVVKKTAPATGKVSALTLEQGKQLLAKNDCLSCHKVDVKLVGPAYKDVAKKYPATAVNYEKLTKKIIAGGSGVWGEVPMSAHPSVPPADIRKMVQYILSLK